MAPTLNDRFRGALLGLAAGDALGHPTEFISSVAAIRQRFGAAGITDYAPAGRHPAGTFTDDTQMTIAVARALALAAHQPLDALMERMGVEFVAWSRHRTNDRAPGGTCLTGCRALERGAPWRQAGVPNSKGCGAAMRAAPIGLMFADDDAALVRVAAASSVLTHAHPTGVVSAVAAAAPVAWLARGNGLDGLLAYTRARVLDVTEALLVELGVAPSAARSVGALEQLAALDRLEAALPRETDDVCSLLGGAWIGEEAVATALWCFLKAGGDFTEAVRRGANSSGDSDSIACIAGSFAGALHGYEALARSSRLIRDVERHDDLLLLADQLFAARDADRPSLPARTNFFDAPEPPPRRSVAELEAEITRHNTLYWVHLQPEISDQAFDALVRELQAAAPASPVLLHLGPPPEPEKAVRHASPMRSLDKCYDEATLVAWTDAFDGDVVAMPKIDGLAISLRYDADGWLVLAATRGDGEVGENITANARAVAAIPRRLPPGAGPVEVRGEVYLSLARFEALRAQATDADSAPKNPRNLAAGALRQKDPQKVAAVGLSFFAYDLRGPALATHRERLDRLEALGFARIPRAAAPKALVMAAVETIAAQRDQLGVETDGVVVIVDDLRVHDALGATSHHPRYAIAWKFQGEEGQSTLRDVRWQVARTGTITPVAVVDPVQLSGVTVTRATLHHAGNLDKLGLQLGATLALVRRGGVIPHVERVVEPGHSPIPRPEACPSCGAPVAVDGDFLLCSAPATCVAATVGRLLHWGQATDLMGLGESVAEQLVDAGLARSPADLYRLDRAALATLDRLGPVLADKLLAEIDKTRRLPLDVVLRGLGIHGLGKTVARAVAAHFGSLDAVRAASAADLAAVPRLGERSAQAVADGLTESAALLDALLDAVTIDAASPPPAGPLSGCQVVFTGALTIDRATAEARVRALGGATPSSVGKSLTHLVIGGDRSKPSTKQKAAEKLIAAGASIELLDEAGFLAWIDAAAADDDGESPPMVEPVVPEPAVVEPAVVEPVAVEPAETPHPEPPPEPRPAGAQLRLFG